jgi:FkbM family methyltransferase
VSEWHHVLQPGDGAIDIGANVGSITKRLAARVGLDGVVVAVEPDPENYQALVKHTQGLPQVMPVQAAVTDTYGDMVELYHDTEGTRHSLWEANLLKAKGSARAVPTVTVDGLAYQVPKLKAIKVDTQGAELLVLAGAQETLQRDGVVWHVEVWPFGLEQAGGSVKGLLDAFWRWGYYPQGVTWDEILSAKHGSNHGALDVVFAR